MPRYLFETQTAARQLDAAVELAALRFPEITVEQRYLEHDGSNGRAILVCRAPSDAHLRRWAVSTQLPLTSLRHIDSHPHDTAGPAPTFGPQHEGDT
jgi:hypothetical protein